MPPEDTNAGDPQNNQQGNGQDQAGKYNPSTLEDALKIIGALTKRVDEREAEARKYKDERDTLTVAQRKQLEEQGNFKALHEQAAAELALLKPAKERLEEIEKGIRKDNEARFATIPDSKKPLVQPLVDVLSPEKLQAYLNANPTLFVKDPAPDYDAGAGAGSGGTPAPKLTDEERMLAKAMRMTDKQYSDMKQQRGQPMELVKKPTTP